MFGYRCQKCGKGMVRPTQVENYKARFGKQVVIVPTATIGVCDSCGAKHYSAAERKRWKALLSQFGKQSDGEKQGKSLTVALTAREWRALRKVADQQGMLPEDLARRWILERLQGGRGKESKFS